MATPTECDAMLVNEGPSAAIAVACMPLGMLPLCCDADSQAVTALVRRLALAVYDTVADLAVFRLPRLFYHLPARPLTGTAAQSDAKVCLSTQELTRNAADGSVRPACLFRSVR